MARQFRDDHPSMKKSNRKTTAGGSTASTSNKPGDGGRSMTPGRQAAGGSAADSQRTTSTPRQPPLRVVTAQKEQMRMSLSTGSTTSSTPRSSRQGGSAAADPKSTPREGLADPILNKQKKHMKFQELCDKWNDSIIRNVGLKFFNGIQFIVNEKDEAFGSPWQRVLCTNAEVPDEDQEEFWNRSNGGKATARTCLNRRRMNIAGQMRTAFMS